MQKSTTFKWQEICHDTAFTDKHQMPKLKRFTGELPKELVSFNRARKLKHQIDAAMHFFIDDRQFNCIWRCPERYIPIFQKCRSIISPDFSLYADMPLPQIMWHSYMNKMVAVWLQRLGFDVIPNISWSRPWSYPFCFEGFPKHSVIAINSTGLGKDPVARAMWQEGYRATCEYLQPTAIVRYGAKQPNENEEISIYFGNNNKTSAENGWKWFA